MREIRLKARAKVNISLDVVRKREDGYHDLSMIMQTVNLYDKVNIKKVKKQGIVLKTNLPFLPTDDRNLVYKVIDYMMNKYQIDKGVYVDLYKVIPIAAGLAGGSSDAAAAIKGMNQLFDLNLSIEEMMGIGKLFGADIPYCLTGGTVLAQGIGDEMTVLPDFPQCYIVISKPHASISTAFVYNNLQLDNIETRPNTELLIEAIGNKDLETISRNLVNVLETVSIAAHPEIEDLKQILLQNGALGALMSGSGSSVFGLFDKKEAAAEAASNLKKLSWIKFAYATTVYNRRDS